MPERDKLDPADRTAHDALLRLVTKAGGRLDTGVPVPVDDLEMLADLFERWSEPHLRDVEVGAATSRADRGCGMRWTG